MKDFRLYLRDTELLAKALESIQVKAKEKSDLGELYASKHGVSVTRDKGNRVRGDTVYSCSQIGRQLTAYFDGVRPRDLMMWVGFIEPQKDGGEQWVIRPEVRSAIKRLSWF
jgi:hypothetical protein